jgi:hypothetical protein
VTVLSNKLVAKRLQLLCDLIPGNAPIGMLAAENNPNTENDVKDAVAAANALGRALHVVKVTPDGDIGAAFAALVRQHVGHCLSHPRRISESGASNCWRWRSAMRCQRLSQVAIT